MAKSRSRPGNLDLDAEVASVRAKLASGRSMSALKLAKDLAKQHPGATTATLLADAYGARIDDLMRAGMMTEAREIVAVASERFPDLADRWRQSATSIARRTGDLDDLLHTYAAATDAKARAAASAELARHVRDPRTIAQSKVLPAGDELKENAALVARAFAAAAAGALGDADRAALRGIARRSSLAAWRSLTLALDAFHRHDDDRCTALLERIDESSPAARGKHLLRAILAGEPITDGGQATARLAARLTDGTHRIRTAVETLAARPETTDRGHAGLDVVVQLAAKNPRLAARLVLWMGTEPAHRDAARQLRDGGGCKIFGEDEWLRLGAISSDQDPPWEDAMLWLSWLFPKRNVLRRLTDIELATVTCRILDSLRRDFDEVLQFVGPRAIEAVGDPNAVRAAAAMFLDDPGVIAQMFGSLLLAWTDLLRHLRSRTSAHPSVPAPVDELALHALALDPQSVAMPDLLRWVPARARARRDQIIAAWAVARPDDPGPWIVRAIDAEERGALRQALTWLDRAESLAPIDQHVRSARFRLLMAQLRKHARAGRRHLCQRDIAALESLPASRAPLRQVYLQALRVALGMAANDDLVDAVGAGRAAAILVLAHADLADGPGLQPPSNDSRRDGLADAAWLKQVRDAVSARARIRLRADADLAQDEDLPDDAALLRSLCELAETGAPRLLALAAHRGLRFEGQHLPRFLLARARSLAATDLGRCRRCSQLARHFAIRAGDAELVRLLHRDADIDEDTAARWLAEERARPALQTGTTNPRPRRRIERGPRLPLSSAEPEASP